MRRLVKKVDRVESNIGLTKWEMFGVPLFGRELSGLLEILSSPGRSPKVWIATVNPEFIMKALEDRQFMDVLQKKTTFNVVDGVGLLWAKETMKAKSAWLMTRIMKRLTVGFAVGVKVLRGGCRETQISGADLIDHLCEMAEKSGKSVFFLGGWGDRGNRAALHFKKKYPKLIVSGSYAGNRVGEDELTLKELSKYKIDYMFVAYAMKTQEEWINRNLDRLDIELVMGVGRTFDYYSGDLKRAPAWVRKMGFEWLFSLLMEPKRWRRQLALPRFIGKVLIER